MLFDLLTKVSTLKPSGINFDPNDCKSLMQIYWAYSINNLMFLYTDTLANRESFKWKIFDVNLSYWEMINLTNMYEYVEQRYKPIA